MPTHTTYLSCVLVIFLLLGVLEAEFKVSAISAVQVDPRLPDLNADGVVNMRDVAICAYAYGSNPGDARWNSAADLNYDGKVDMRDFALVAKDFGKNCQSYDFNELSGWNVSSGNWIAQNGTLEGAPSPYGLIYSGDVTWKDCTFTAEVKIAADSPEAKVALCLYIDPENLYWAGFGCWGHRFFISRSVAGVPQELAFSGEGADVDREVWHIVTVKISSGAIMLYVDDSLELAVNDSTFESGLVGIGAWNSHVIVDYVTVIGTRPAALPAHDVLYADGAKLRSPSGEEVSLVGTQIDYNVLKRNVWFSMDDVQRIKSYGGVVLELQGLLFSEMMPQRGVLDQIWIDRLDEWVSWCEQARLYCIVTFGNFEYKPWGPEAPSWFLEGKYSQPWNETTWNQASIDFWDVDNPLQESNRQAVLTGFQFIADRYRNNKYVLFGLFNEPFCLNGLVNYRNAEHLSIAYARFVERIVDTMRSAGARQLIFVDKPYCWFYTDHFETVNRSGIVWEDHLYVSPNSSIDQWKTALSEYVQRYVYSFNKPFYLGEYAPYPYSAYESTLSDWRTILKEQVTFLKTLPVCGYSWWEYPWLEGEYYDYEYNNLNADDSLYILTTIFG